VSGGKASKFATLRWAYSREDLSGTEKSVLAYLAYRANDETGECFPGQVLMAKECSLTDRSVRRALASLKEKGLLTSQRRFQNSDIHTLALPGPDAIPDSVAGIIRDSMPDMAIPDPMSAMDADRSGSIPDSVSVDTGFCVQPFRTQCPSIPVTESDKRSPKNQVETSEGKNRKTHPLKPPVDNSPAPIATRPQPFEAPIEQGKALWRDSHTPVLAQLGRQRGFATPARAKAQGGFPWEARQASLQELLRLYPVTNRRQNARLLYHGLFEGADNLDPDFIDKVLEGAKRAAHHRTLNLENWLRVRGWETDRAVSRWLEPGYRPHPDDVTAAGKLFMELFPWPKGTGPRSHSKALAEFRLTVSAKTSQSRFNPKMEAILDGLRRFVDQADPSTGYGKIDAVNWLRRKRWLDSDYEPSMPLHVAPMAQQPAQQARADTRPAQGELIEPAMSRDEARRYASTRVAEAKAAMAANRR
jgi:Helix-turn-helix domain